MNLAPIAVEPVACQGCGVGAAFDIVARGPDYDNHACGDQQFTLVQCRDCLTHYLNPRPTPAMLPRIYASDTYYAYSLATEGNPAVLRARQQRDAQKVALLWPLLDRAPAGCTVLDIGAGDGALLEVFRRGGVPAAQLSGLEVDEGAAESLRQRGFNGIFGRVEDIDIGTERFDIITMIQVIEHVAEPRLVLEKCRRALRPGGLLLIETPNMRSWDRPLFRRQLWGGYHFPRHWTLWDTESLPRLLDRSGYTTVHLSTPPAAVLWAWSLNHVAQYLGAPPRVCRWFGLSNPVLLAALWVLELIPSRLGLAANMRIIARAT